MEKDHPSHFHESIEVFFMGAQALQNTALETVVLRNNISSNLSSNFQLKSSYE